MKLSFSKILLNLIGLLKKIPHNFAVIACYAGILTLLSAVTGLLPSCQLGREGGWWCYMENSDGSYPLYLFGLNKFLYLFICCLFFTDFYDAAFNEQNFRLRNILVFSKSKLKTLAFLMGIVFLLLGSISAVFAIILKKANPDWRIEFIYFLIAFICCWVPFILLRFSAAVSYMASGERPSFKLIWQKTSDRNFHIIFAYILIFIVINFVSLYANVLLKIIMLKSFNFAISLAADFVYNSLSLIYICVFMLLFRAMHQIMTAENSSPSDENTAMDSQKNDAVLPTAENDNSRVKKNGEKRKTAEISQK